MFRIAVLPHSPGVVYYHKGVYPQSDGSLAIVNIDASKGFVDLWVHLSFAFFAIFDLIDN